ncbi:MAG: prephenate dehydrogenase/arogenate dehydrogenase family protein [Thermoproteota archaeon]|nr:prephenate dehydrogenase/arogenate dehydrogenase family protein [Thermoproteota archaeon]
MAIVGAAGKMGTWFASYFAHRGLNVSAFDINQKKILKTSSKVKVQESLFECVHDADLVLVSVPVHKTPQVVKECTKNMKDGAIIAEISSVKNKTYGVLKKIPSNLRPLCIHPMFGPGASKKVETRMLLIPVRNEKIEVTIVKEIFEDADLIVLPNAKQHDKSIAVVLGLTYFVNMVFAKVMSSGNNLSMLKQVSGTTFSLQSLIAESIFTEEPDLVIALISENVYAKRYINRFLKETAALAELTIKKDNKELKDELQKVKLNMQKSQDLKQSYNRMYEIIGKPS